jgi:hypothetical protein
VGNYLLDGITHTATSGKPETINSRQAANKAAKTSLDAVTWIFFNAD